MLEIRSAQKKWRLFRSWITRHPIWCAWQVTYRCNFRCGFCDYWKDPLGKVREPSPAEYALGAKKLATFGTMMISLAGGEPFIRHDLPEIVSAVGKYHFPFVTTNGYLVTNENARAMMSAGLWGASVSIDYADANLHDAKRGKQGAYDAAWRAVDLLSNARKHKHQRVNVIAVLMDDNLEHIEPLINIAAKRGAYFMVQPYGYLKTGSHEHEHTSGVSEKLVALRRKYPNFLSNPEYLGKFDVALKKGVPGCRAGKAFFNIDSAGGVAVCVERKTKPVANVFSDTGSLIHQRLQKSSNNNTCTDCWYNCRGEVETLYNPIGLAKSLPTLLFDQGKAPKSLINEQ